MIAETYVEVVVDGDNKGKGDKRVEDKNQAVDKQAAAEELDN